MRPKKRIVMVDTDEERLSVRRLMLSVNRFAVWGAGSVGEAGQLLERVVPQVIVLAWPLDEPAVEALLRANREWLHARVLVIASGGVLPALLPDRWLIGPSEAQVLDAVRGLAEGKRGPRKKPVSAVGKIMSGLAQERDAVLGAVPVAGSAERSA